jgi:hypothetical protein
MVEEARGRDLGDSDLGHWMFLVGDIDFVLARSGSTNARADQSTTAVGTVTVDECASGTASIEAVSQGRKLRPGWHIFKGGTRAGFGSSQEKSPNAFV